VAVLNAALLLLLQALSLILFFNRWIAGVSLKLLRRHEFDEVNLTFQPTVTVVVPMFNEGANIRGTLESLLALNYPAGKLDIIVIDDCSTDDSYDHANAVARVSGGRLCSPVRPRWPAHAWARSCRRACAQPESPARGWQRSD
jgi:cellulose synthase/poly-beta-1,6-N-acetylglucosamine synthase-like glycosyltransferase